MERLRIAIHVEISTTLVTFDHVRRDTLPVPVESCDLIEDCGRGGCDSERALEGEVFPPSDEGWLACDAESCCHGCWGTRAINSRMVNLWQLKIDIRRRCCRPSNHTVRSIDVCHPFVGSLQDHSWWHMSALDHFTDGITRIKMSKALLFQQFFIMVSRSHVAGAQVPSRSTQSILLVLEYPHPFPTPFTPYPSGVAPPIARFLSRRGSTTPRVYMPATKTPAMNDTRL